MVARLTLPEHPPSEEDIRLAEASSRHLARLMTPGRSLRLAPPDDDGAQVEIPAAAAELLVRVLTEMAKGNAVTLIPIHAELTTQHVADLLGVSRPFVVKEIEARRLPARRVGTHRRVLFSDLLEYKRRMDAERQQALDELSRLDEELGLQ